MLVSWAAAWRWWPAVRVQWTGCGWWAGWGHTFLALPIPDPGTLRVLETHTVVPKKWATKNKWNVIPLSISFKTHLNIWRVHAGKGPRTVQSQLSILLLLAGSALEAASLLLMRLLGKSHAVVPRILNVLNNQNTWNRSVLTTCTVRPTTELNLSAHLRQLLWDTPEHMVIEVPSLG